MTSSSSLIDCTGGPGNDSSPTRHPTVDSARGVPRARARAFCFHGSVADHGSSSSVMARFFLFTAELTFGVTSAVGSLARTISTFFSTSGWRPKTLPTLLISAFSRSAATLLTSSSSDSDPSSLSSSPVDSWSPTDGSSSSLSSSRSRGSRKLVDV